MTKNVSFFHKDLQIIFCVTMIAVMEVTCIAPVLPRIAEALSLTPARTNLLIVVFTMPGIFLSPFFGIASDRFGRKNVLVPALILFGTCGTLAFFTRDFNLILLLRFLQGAGAASIGSLNQTIIGDIFPGKDRVIAMGYNNSVLNVGTMLYPSIGGAIALLGWYYPFLLASLAFPVSLLVIFCLDIPDHRKSGDIIDYLKKTCSIIKKKNLLLLYTGTLAVFILLYGILLAVFPFYMRKHFHTSTLLTGIIMSTSSIGAITGSFNLGRLAGYFTSKKLMLAGYVFYAMALIMTIFIPNIILFSLPVIIFGFANGILIPNIQTQISILAPSEYRGACMSINSTVLRLGQTLGPFISGIIITGYGEAYTFISGSAFALATAYVIYLGVPDMGRLEDSHNYHS